MSEEKKKQKDNKEKQEWNQRAKEIWLAGLGALSAVEEEGAKVFRNLVNRGEDFENKRKEQMDELWDEVSRRYKKAGSRVGDTFEEFEGILEKNVKSAISGMGIPTRRELEELSEKVDKLSQKLEKMEQKKTAAGSQNTKKSSSQTGKKQK